MNNIFTLTGCFLCEKAKKAVLKANINLPIGEKINIIEVMSDDPRLKLMAKLYKSNNPYNYRTPTIRIGRQTIHRENGQIVKGMSDFVFIHSVFSEKEYHDVLNHFTSKF